jgi:effector-binding domain-containing protein
MDTGQSPEAVGVEDREPQPVLSIRANVRVAQLTQAQGESLQALWSFMERRGVTPAGPPYVRYHTFGETEADLETGIPVAETVAGEGRAAAGELPGGAAITTWHLGSHDGLADAYGRLGSWLQANAGRWTALRGRSTGGSTPAWNQTPRPGPRRQSGARSWSNRSSDPADQRSQADAE